MPNQVQKPCKICGKLFTPCADCERDKTVFHWKRVACSPECARAYFAKIKESRQESIFADRNVTQESPKTHERLVKK